MKRTIKQTMVNRFIIQMKEEEKSNATIEKYVRDLRGFTEYVGNRSVDKLLVLQYKAKLGEEYKHSSANSMISSINSFFKFVGWLDCCVKQYKIQRRTFCSKETELTKSDYKKLVKAAEQSSNTRLCLLIQTLCSTGIRISELPHITFEAVLRGEATVCCKGKIRKIFIVSELKRKLLKFAKLKSIKTGAIFVTKKGTPLNRSNIWREMKKLCIIAGVSPEKVFPHNFRHLFAKTFYRIEKDIAKLADILGHSNINTTRIYIVSTCEEHRQKMERLMLIL